MLAMSKRHLFRYDGQGAMHRLSSRHLRCNEWLDLARPLSIVSGRRLSTIAGIISMLALSRRSIESDRTAIVVHTMRPWPIRQYDRSHQLYSMCARIRSRRQWTNGMSRMCCGVLYWYTRPSRLYPLSNGHCDGYQWHHCLLRLSARVLCRYTGPHSMLGMCIRTSGVDAKSIRMHRLHIRNICECHWISAMRLMSGRHLSRHTTTVGLQIMSRRHNDRGRTSIRMYTMCARNHYGRQWFGVGPVPRMLGGLCSSAVGSIVVHIMRCGSLFWQCWRHRLFVVRSWQLCEWHWHYSMRQLSWWHLSSESRTIVVHCMSCWYLQSVHWFNRVLALSIRQIHQCHWTDRMSIMRTRHI